MVAVEFDGNYIDGEPLQSRSAKSLTKAYHAIFQRWKATGVICLNWHILDNEASAELKQAICENKCRVDFTPADHTDEMPQKERSKRLRDISFQC